MKKGGVEDKDSDLEDLKKLLDENELLCIDLITASYT